MVYVPAAGLFLPSASPIAVVGGAPVPASNVTALPEYSPVDFRVNYTSNGSDGQSGLFWTELWYESTQTKTWTLYAPPWNPSGQWQGVPSTGPRGQQIGSILFDTYLTGGQDAYNVTTVAVDRGFVREPGPPACLPAPACDRKAHTTVDTLPPVLFVARPSPGSWTNSEILEWTATDAVSGVADVRVSVDGGAAQTFVGAAGTMNMSLPSQGAHTVNVTAVDRAGNAVTVPIPFHYDTTAPTLAFTTPAANAYLNTSDVDVAWTMSDPAGISDLRLSVDSLPPIALANDTTSYALRGLGETAHVVSLVAVDPAGNLAVETLGFRVDVTPPSLQIAMPVSGTYSNSRQIQVVWMGSDSGSGIDHYDVSLDGGVPATVTDAAGYAFQGVAEGAHTVLVKAVDRAGNVAVATSTVTVDVTPPAIVITAPQQGATVYGNASVNWTAGDDGSGIAKVVVIADGAASPAAPGQRTMALSPTLGVGPHAVTVEAWDKAGNVNELTVAFLYGGATPPTAGPSSVPAFDFAWVLAAVLLIAVGSAYVAVRRRRKRSP